MNKKILSNHGESFDKLLGLRGDFSFHIGLPKAHTQNE